MPTTTSAFPDNFGLGRVYSDVDIARHQLSENHAFLIISTFEYIHYEGRNIYEAMDDALVLISVESHSELQVWMGSYEEMNPTSQPCVILARNIQNLKLSTFVTALQAEHDNVVLSWLLEKNHPDYRTALSYLHDNSRLKKTCWHSCYHYLSFIGPGMEYNLYIYIGHLKELVELSNRFLYEFQYPTELEGLPEEFHLVGPHQNDSVCLVRDGNSADVIAVHWRTKQVPDMSRAIDRGFRRECRGQGFANKKSDLTRIRYSLITAVA
jgi:hypothetical protein